ncbi:hypothetical protein LVY72_15765 [Arthrobacter sp. I2-34]|uniref:Uncharacterized protein n=1 Tax=Arthrobacter hankyongi TaxID=2904801 RepID=A0ABS9LA67_9MICC|nr:hypothetical protein [Arthrobacter hankyongi]MCG2623354.1 hypothetical protein [Arthrobacter hankyongi]
MDERLIRVRSAAADKEWQEFQLDNADADLRDAVREALAAGIQAEDLAAAAELTLEQIRAIGRNDRPDSEAAGNIG